MNSKILIVEDEKRVADLLKIGLEENGYQTMVAYDGAMGLRLFQSNSFQLVMSIGDANNPDIIRLNWFI